MNLVRDWNPEGIMKTITTYRSDLLELQLERDIFWYLCHSSPSNLRIVMNEMKKKHLFSSDVLNFQKRKDAWKMMHNVLSPEKSTELNYQTP